MRKCWYKASAGIVISIHLPPPVMIDSAADRALVTHMLCCSCAMCFSAAASSENVDQPVQRRRQISMDRVLDPALDVGDGSPGIALVPSPVQRLGGDTELDDEIVAQVLRFGLAALFLPQPAERCFVSAHDDSGVRSADELASVLRISCECS